MEDKRTGESLAIQRRAAAWRRYRLLLAAAMALCGLAVTGFACFCQYYIFAFPGIVFIAYAGFMLHHQRKFEKTMKQLRQAITTLNKDGFSAD